MRNQNNFSPAFARRRDLQEMIFRYHVIVSSESESDAFLHALSISNHISAGLVSGVRAHPDFLSAALTSAKKVQLYKERRV